MSGYDYDGFNKKKNDDITQSDLNNLGHFTEEEYHQTYERLERLWAEEDELIKNNKELSHEEIRKILRDKYGLGKADQTKLYSAISEMRKDQQGEENPVIYPFNKLQFDKEAMERVRKGVLVAKEKLRGFR